MPSTTADTLQELVQGVLAIMVLAGALVYGIILVLRGGAGGDLPGWLGISVGTVMGWYFGARAGIPTMRAITDGPMQTLVGLAQRGPRRATDPTPPETAGEP